VNVRPIGWPNEKQQTRREAYRHRADANMLQGALLSQMHLASWKNISMRQSRMNVTSNVTRYSVILPFSTLPLSEITSNPVTPRSVLVARFRPSSAAC